MKDKIIDIAKNNNGYITGKIMKEHNIPSIYIYRLAKAGVFEKVDKGIFVLKDFIQDSFYNIQLLYPNLIFCEETALYLNGLSNAQFSGYYGTIPYENSIPKYDNLKVIRSRKVTVGIGVEEVVTPYGNSVKCYDKERMICDLFINPAHYDYEDRVYAINKYNSDYLNIDKLYNCARQLKVYDEVRNVFEVIRWN